MEKNKKLLATYGIGSLVCAVLASHSYLSGGTGWVVLVVPLIFAICLTALPPKQLGTPPAQKNRRK